MKYHPRRPQQLGIKYLVSQAHAGLFLDPGLGKTSTVLAAFQILRDRGFVDKVLVVAPRRVCLLVWPKEARKWDDFRDLRVHFLHGKGRDLSVDADVYLLNPEGLEWLAKELAKTRRLPFQWLVVDESTKFKRTSTRRFKLLKGLLPRFLRRTILTGTPTPQGLLDLFGQAYVMDQGQSLGRYVTHYRAQFFYPSGFGGYTWLPREGSYEAILDRLRPRVLTTLAEDWLDLPERLDNVVPVELPPEARRVYRELEREMISKIGDEKLVVGSASAVSMKCRQLTGGSLYHEVVDVRTGKKRVLVTRVHDAKLEALEDLLEELGGQPAIVVYEFKHELELLRERLGRDTPALSGGLDDAELLDLERRWNAGRIPVLLAQSAANAHGLNLQDGGHHLIWYTLTYDYETFHQLNLRVLRQGQRHRSVTFHYLVAQDSVDEDVLATVNKKHGSQRQVLRDLAASARRRLGEGAPT